MRAYIFPGQGSQTVGMLRAAYLESAQVRDILDRANDVLGYELSGIMFEGPDEELRQTKNAQPAIFLHGYILYRMIEKPEAAMVAGHSLGEYTALTAANVLTFDDALRLVQVRANAMQAAGAEMPGTMAAIIGMDDDAVTALCNQVTEEVGMVRAANFNTPGQVVVSGTPEGVAAAMERAKGAGARMAKQLNVSGAFHSPLMEPARTKLAQALEATPFRDAEMPVYVNISAEPLVSAADLRDALLHQLTAPVLWTRTIERMAADGATEFIEVGPGNALQGMVKRIAAGTTVRGIADLADLPPNGE